MTVYRIILWIHVWLKYLSEKNISAFSMIKVTIFDDKIFLMVIFVDDNFCWWQFLRQHRPLKWNLYSYDLFVINFSEKLFAGAYQRLRCLKTKIIKIFIINKSLDKRIKDRKLPFYFHGPKKPKSVEIVFKFEFPQKYPKIIEIKIIELHEEIFWKKKYEK